MTVAARVSILVEVVLATVAALFLSLRLGRSSVWVIVPVAALLLRRHPLDDLALEPRVTPPSLRTHAVLGLGALLVYAIAHGLVAVLFADAHPRLRLPPDLLGLTLFQLVAVAFPEELFFRGYLQSSLDRVFGKPWRMAAARVGPGLFVQAVVFGACHLATGDWTRLRVVFFGLLAGWLRARSGSIVAPIAYHAVGNVWYAVVAASFRS